MRQVRFHGFTILVMDEQPDQRTPFSLNLLKYRKMRGLTQQQIADLSGLSQRMIAYYETQISNPPINNVIALARALDITVAELIGELTEKHAPLFEDVDPRTLRKIMMISKLSRADRSTIYSMIDALLQKSGQDEKQGA